MIKLLPWLLLLAALLGAVTLAGAETRYATLTMQGDTSFLVNGPFGTETADTTVLVVTATAMLPCTAFPMLTLVGGMDGQQVLIMRDVNTVGCFQVQYPGWVVLKPPYGYDGFTFVHIQGIWWPLPL